MKTVLGIRREDKNPWERRVPLIPSHVRELEEKYSIEFRLQPSPRRIFNDKDYILAGADVGEDLSVCPIVFAVKEIPLSFFKKGRTYIFFSHTIKGQPYNMPMLKKMRELECTLIDYERIANKKGQRLVFFGPQAGQAGMIDTFHALGQRLSYEGISSPFASLKSAYQYGSLVEAKEDVAKIGWKIQKSGLDSAIVPFVCAFAGYGRVFHGAQEIFDLLPKEDISPEDLINFVHKQNCASNKVYKVVFKEEHMVRPKSPEDKFDLQDYYDHPQNYCSFFHEYIPYLTILINCIYWAPQYPRLVSKKYLKDLWTHTHSPKLKVIGDISCDIEGAIECTVHATNPDQPTFVYDPVEKKTADGIQGRGVVVMAIDNLPAEISMESSLFFSQALKPFVPGIAKADFSGDFESCKLPPEIKKAVILYKGKFTRDYAYMKKFI